MLRSYVSDFDLCNYVTKSVIWNSQPVDAGSKTERISRWESDDGAVLTISECPDYELNFVTYKPAQTAKEPSPKRGYLTDHERSTSMGCWHADSPDRRLTTGRCQSPQKCEAATATHRSRPPTRLRPRKALGSTRSQLCRATTSRRSSTSAKATAKTA